MAKPSTQSGSWLPMFPPRGSSFSLLPSMCSLITQNFFVTRKIRWKQSPQILKRSESHVNHWDVHISHIVLPFGGLSINILNLRHNAKNSPTFSTTPQWFQARQCARATWVLFTKQMSRFHCWSVTVGVEPENFYPLLCDQLLRKPTQDTVISDPQINSSTNNYKKWVLLCYSISEKMKCLFEIIYYSVCLLFYYINAVVSTKQL